MRFNLQYTHTAIKAFKSQERRTVLFLLTLDVSENGQKASRTTNILIASLMFIEQPVPLDARTTFRNMYKLVKPQGKFYI